MRKLLLALGLVAAAAAPASAGDVYEVWDEDPGHYVIERRVIVETIIRPHYAPSYARRAYVYTEDDPYYQVPQVDHVAPFNRRYRVVQDHDVEHCTVKRRWRHGRLIEKIRCD